MSKELQSYIGTKKIVIEAGHIKAKVNPGNEQEQGVNIVVNMLESIPNSTHKTLLVDDRTTQLKSGDLTNYIKWLTDHGYKPDTVFLESELFKPAFELHHELRDRYPHDFLMHMATRGRRSRGEGIRTDAGLASLLTLSGEPSVELMDAALYLEKERLGDMSLTVLPEQYIDQQKKTLALLDKAQRRVPVAHVFFRPGKEGVVLKTNK